MAEIEFDFPKEYHELWQAYVALSKQLPNDEAIKHKACKAQMNYLRSLALERKYPWEGS